MWQIDANVNVETVALHEAGHGLSQGHFGKGFVTSSNGKLHFSPRAVMNAAYNGVQQDIDQTDNAGHCSIWGQWPNNYAMIHRRAPGCRRPSCFTRARRTDQGPPAGAGSTGCPRLNARFSR